MNAQEKALVKRLMKALDEMVDLLTGTNDADRIKEIIAQRDKALEQIDAIAERGLDAEDRQYRRITTGLNESSQMIHDAIKGMESVAKAIESIARVLDQIEKVIMAAA